MGESIRHALWVIVQFVVVAIALLLFLGVVVAYGMKISIWPIIAMMAIVVYRLLPKTVGVFGIATAIIIACLYFDVMAISALFFQPLHFLMMCVVTTKMVMGSCGIHLSESGCVLFVQQRYCRANGIHD